MITIDKDYQLASVILPDHYYVQRITEFNAEIPRHEAEAIRALVKEAYLTYMNMDSTKANEIEIIGIPSYGDYPEGYKWEKHWLGTYSKILGFTNHQLDLNKTGDAPAPFIKMSNNVVLDIGNLTFKELAVRANKRMVEQELGKLGIKYQDIKDKPIKSLLVEANSQSFLGLLEQGVIRLEEEYLKSGEVAEVSNNGEIDGLIENVYTGSDINDNFLRETKEKISINGVELPILPTDVSFFTDNSMIEEAYIRAPGAFAFKSKHARSEVTLTLAIPVSDVAHPDKSPDPVAQMYVKGLELIASLNAYPFCFVKSNRIKSYLGAHNEDNIDDIMMFGVKRIKVTQDARANGIILLEITLLFNNHRALVKDFTFKSGEELPEGVDLEGRPYHTAESYNLFQRMLYSVSKINIAEAQQHMINFTGIEGKNNFSTRKVAGSVRIKVPEFINLTEVGLETFDNKDAFEEKDNLRKTGSGEKLPDSDLSSIIPDVQDDDLEFIRLPKLVGTSEVFVNNNNFITSDPSDITPSEAVQAPSLLSDEYAVVWLEDKFAYDEDLNPIQQVTVIKDRAFASHFVGSFQHPYLQFMASYPATVEISSAYSTSNYDESTSFPYLYKLLMGTIDANSVKFPLGNIYNYAKVECLATFLLEATNVVPKQSSISAQASNSNMEVFACSFVENSMNRMRESAKVRVGKEIINPETFKDIRATLESYIQGLEAYLATGNKLTPAEEAFHDSIKNDLKHFNRIVNHVYNPDDYKGEVTFTDALKNIHNSAVSQVTDSMFSGHEATGIFNSFQAFGQTLIGRDDLAKETIDRLSLEYFYAVGDSIATGLSPRGIALTGSDWGKVKNQISSIPDNEDSKFLLVSSGFSNNPDLGYNILDKSSGLVSTLKAKINSMIYKPKIVAVIGVANNMSINGKDYSSKAKNFNAELKSQVQRAGWLWLGGFEAKKEASYTVHMEEKYRQEMRSSTLSKMKIAETALQASQVQKDIDKRSESIILKNGTGNAKTVPQRSPTAPVGGGSVDARKIYNSDFWLNYDGLQRMKVQTAYFPKVTPRVLNRSSTPYEEYYSTNSKQDRWIDPAADKDLLALLQAYGKSLYLRNGYRSKAWMENNGRGLNGRNVNKATAPYGYSEHNTGFAMDFYHNKGSDGLSLFKNTKAFTWMYENSFKYNFYLSFNTKSVSNKGRAQGVNDYGEPWHFVWLGNQEAIKANQYPGSPPGSGSSFINTSVTSPNVTENSTTPATPQFSLATLKQTPLTGSSDTSEVKSVVDSLHKRDEFERIKAKQVNGSKLTPEEEQFLSSYNYDYKADNILKGIAMRIDLSKGFNWPSMSYLGKIDTVEDANTISKLNDNWLNSFTGYSYHDMNFDRIVSGKLDPRMIQKLEPTYFLNTTPILTKEPLEEAMEVLDSPALKAMREQMANGIIDSVLSVGVNTGDVKEVTDEMGHFGLRTAILDNELKETRYIREESKTWVETHNQEGSKASGGTSLQNKVENSSTSSSSLYTGEFPAAIAKSIGSLQKSQGKKIGEGHPATVRALMDFVMRMEGTFNTGYETVYGGKTRPGLTSIPHPGAEGRGSSAAGAFQYMGSTDGWLGVWDGKNPIMSVENQNKGFEIILKKRVKGLYEAVVEGNWDKVFSMKYGKNDAIGSIWASIPENSYKTTNGRPQQKSGWTRAMNIETCKILQKFYEGATTSTSDFKGKLTEPTEDNGISRAKKVATNNQGTKNTRTTVEKQRNQTVINLTNFVSAAQAQKELNNKIWTIVDVISGTEFIIETTYKGETQKIAIRVAGLTRPNPWINYLINRQAPPDGKTLKIMGPRLKYLNGRTPHVGGQTSYNIGYQFLNQKIKLTNLYSSYDRFLASDVVLIKDNSDLSKLLVELGAARPVGTNTRKDLKDAQDKAKQNNLGLWGIAEYAINGVEWQPILSRDGKVIKSGDKSNESFVVSNTKATSQTGTENTSKDVIVYIGGSSAENYARRVGTAGFISTTDHTKMDEYILEQRKKLKKEQKLHLYVDVGIDQLINNPSIKNTPDFLSRIQTTVNATVNAASRELIFLSPPKATSITFLLLPEDLKIGSKLTARQLNDFIKSAVAKSGGNFKFAIAPFVLGNPNSAHTPGHAVVDNTKNEKGHAINNTSTASSVTSTTDKEGRTVISVTTIPADHKIHDTVKYLKEHAHNKSKGRCALYWRKAIGATLTKNFTPQGSAYMYHTNGTMYDIGFIRIAPDTPLLKGDTLIMTDPRPNKPHGHIHMFDGESNWISDFAVGSAYVYNKHLKKGQTKQVALYRLKDLAELTKAVIIPRSNSWDDGSLVGSKGQAMASAGNASINSVSGEGDNVNGASVDLSGYSWDEIRGHSYSELELEDNSISVYSNKMKKKKHFEKMMKPFEIGLNTCFPVVKAYIVIGNEDDDIFIDGLPLPPSVYYELPPIQNFNLECNNDYNPVDVCTFSCINPSSVRTSLEDMGDLGLYADPNAINTQWYNPSLFNKMRLVAGAKVHIKVGYSNDPNKLVTVFNGSIVETSGTTERLIDCVCESYAMELLGTQVGPIKPIDFAGDHNASTGLIFGYAMLMDNITHFGAQLGRFQTIKAWLPSWATAANIGGGIAVAAAGGLVAGPVGAGIAIAGYVGINLIANMLTGKEDRGVGDSELTYATGEAPPTLSVWGGKGRVGDFRDPENKALVSPISAGNFLWNAFNMSRANLNQRIYMNIYADAIENVHDTFKDSWWARWPKILSFDTKVFYRFFVFRSTAWAIMKEMEWRHPGTLVKPMMYEDRQSMFFGLKEQLYIARDLDPTFMNRVGFESRFNDPNKPFVKKYLAEREKRMDVASGFHLLSTRTNVLSNNIKLNRDFATKVTTVFYERKYDKNATVHNQDSDTMLLDKTLSKFDIKEKVIAMPGTHGDYLSWMYGTQELKKEIENMYTGRIIVTGNPHIKAGDYCYIEDVDKRISGTIKVKECSHLFSAETGYTTVIVPGLYAEAAHFLWDDLFIKLAFGAKMVSERLAVEQTMGMQDNEALLNYKKALTIMSSIKNPSAEDYAYQLGGYLVLGGLMGLTGRAIVSAVMSRTGAIRNGYNYAKAFTRGLYSGTGRFGFNYLSTQFKAGYNWISKLHNASKISASVKDPSKLLSIKRFFSWTYLKKLPKRVISKGMGRVIWNLGARQAIGLFTRLTTLAVLNPITTVALVVAGFLVSWLTSAVRKMKLTHNAISFFPLNYNGQPFTAGISGYSNKGALDAAWHNFQKNMNIISRSAESLDRRYDNSIVGLDTIQTVSGWFAGSPSSKVKIDQPVLPELAEAQETSPVTITGDPRQSPENEDDVDLIGEIYEDDGS